MYGIEVLWRASILAFAAFGLLLGWILVGLGRTKKGSRRGFYGSALIIVSSLTLLVIGADVGLSRHKDTTRQEYPQRTVSELIRIARADKDQHALYAITMKKDSAAVTALSEILLDENEDLVLRHIAAHSLGEIGGDAAKTALARARCLSGNTNLMGMIDYALEAIEKREKNEE